MGTLPNQDTQTVEESSKDGAGDGIRTRDINLGKVALYQLSYSRACGTLILALRRSACQFSRASQGEHSEDSSGQKFTCYS